MAIPSGTRLGGYEILAPLGAGGMGEVYRARDTQLKREVALKTLPSGVTGDADRLARFQREAEVLAALNHSNIAQIHGLADGQLSGVAVRALVMELVEGEDLAQRIGASGAIPLPEALAIARQIAMALDYAHDRGIVHRDLKPANIKVTPDGHVKVLDFGLAKALDRPDGSADAEAPALQTITSPAMTMRGVILGTAAYMSPEQAKGKLVDKRADIWAFGCVLFEMLTGKRTFDGEDVTDSIVAVMSRDPSWQTLPPATPAAVRKLLRRCLEKDRSRRLADIRDALFEIEEAIAQPDTATDAAAPGRAAVSRRGAAGWLVLGTVVGAAIVGAVVAIGVPRVETPSTRPLDLSFTHADGSSVSSAHISPDGTRVAYRARRSDGLPLIFVRHLESGRTTPLAGTENGWWPFWSPDSKHIGFWANRMLKRIPVDGGPVQLIAHANSGVALGASWAGDTILFAGSDYEGLLTVSASGGATTRVSTLPGIDWAHLWPSFLPDGRQFVFTARHWTRAAEATEQGIYLGSLDHREARRLLPDLSSATYSPPGYLLFARNGQLSTVAFDVKAGRVVGEPTALNSSVAWDAAYYAAAVSASTMTGTLAIRESAGEVMREGAGESQLVIVDRLGRSTKVGEARHYDGALRISPDGTRVAVGIRSLSTATVDIHSIDLSTGAPTAVTAAQAFVGWPAWLPDGRLSYAYQTPGILDDVYVKDLMTSQAAPLIQSTDSVESPVAWSNNGDFLILYKSVKEGSSVQVWSAKSKTLSHFADGPMRSVAFSPDDRYAAIESWESGQVEVHVTTFPNRRQTWPLTTDGGRVISWSADGREILVATLRGHIVAYQITADASGFRAGTPTVLLPDVGGNASFSAATRDHSRIVLRTNVAAATDRGEIRLLFGWTSRLQQPRP